MSAQSYDELHFFSWLFLTILGGILGITLPIVICISTFEKNALQSFEIGLIAGSIFEIVSLIGINFLYKANWYVPVSWFWVGLTVVEVSVLTIVSTIWLVLGFIISYAFVFAIGILYNAITSILFSITILSIKNIYIYDWLFASYFVTLIKTTLALASIILGASLFFAVFNQSYPEIKHALVILVLLGAINVSGNLYNVNSGSAIACSSFLSAIAMLMVLLIKPIFT
ncbi:MAG: hypothetical protein ACRC11_13210 [Xenococcaceae cyanobacterium]